MSSSVHSSSTGHLSCCCSYNRLSSGFALQMCFERSFGRLLGVLERFQPHPDSLRTALDVVGEALAVVYSVERAELICLEP